MLPLYGGPVQSLMGELRSHKLCEVDYRILKKEERKTSFFRRHSVHSISFPKCSNSINLIQNFCHWQWKIVNIRIIHLYFSPRVQCKSKAVRDAESTYLEPESFLTNSSRCVCEFQLWEMHWEVGEKEAVLFWNNPLSWISTHVFPSLSQFSLWLLRLGCQGLARGLWADVMCPESGPRQLGAGVPPSVFCSLLWWLEVKDNRSTRWPGWDFMFIEKWVFLLSRHSLALPD